MTILSDIDEFFHQRRVLAATWAEAVGLSDLLRGGLTPPSRCPCRAHRKGPGPGGEPEPRSWPGSEAASPPRHESGSICAPAFASTVMLTVARSRACA
jgi:hypothetical protein